MLFATSTGRGRGTPRFAVHWGQAHQRPARRLVQSDPVDNVVEFTRDATTVGLENEWHSDGTFRTMPTLGTILRPIEVPAVGGDTLFADLAAAFDNLPPERCERIVGMTAMHDWSIGEYAGKYGDRLDEYRAPLPPVEHPVVIAHPETGRPTLFVNRLFTSHIVGRPGTRATNCCAVVPCAMVDRPELQCRWRWEPGSIAMWNNLACNHYGANDYFPPRRVMARATMFSRGHLAACVACA